MAWETTQAQVKVKVVGNTVELPAKDVTPDKIISLAKSEGLSRFIVKLNGTEIDSPSNFPELKGGETIEVIPYDEWG